MSFETAPPAAYADVEQLRAALRLVTAERDAYRAACVFAAPALESWDFDHAAFPERIFERNTAHWAGDSDWLVRSPEAVRVILAAELVDELLGPPAHENAPGGEPGA